MVAIIGEQKIVCESCQRVIRDGNHERGTKFVVCTACIIKKNPGADPTKLVGPDGRKAPIPLAEKKKAAKTLNQLDRLEEEMAGKQLPMDMETEYVMFDGKVMLIFNMHVKGMGKFDFGLSLDQLEYCVAEMKEIREKAEAELAAAKLEDNLEE